MFQTELAALNLVRLDLSGHIELQVEALEKGQHGFDEVYSHYLNSAFTHLDGWTRLTLSALLCAEASAVQQFAVAEVTKGAFDYAVQNNLDGIRLMPGSLDDYVDVFNIVSQPFFKKPLEGDTASLIEGRVRGMVVKR